jgi:hypothetical protein
MLQGVTMLQVEAMPICGRLKSSSEKPTARNIARLGARSSLSTTTREYRRIVFSSMGLPDVDSAGSGLLAIHFNSGEV